MADAHLDLIHVGELQRLLVSERVLNTMATGIVLQGEDGVILDYNIAATNLLGVSGDELIGMKSTDPSWRVIREDGSPLSLEERPSIAALRSGETSAGVIEGIDVAGQPRRWLSVNSHPVELENGYRVVVSSFVDVTSRVQRERLLRLLAEVSREVLGAATETDAHQRLCNALVHYGDYALAWIGVPSTSNEQGIVVSCAAGETGYLLDDVDQWWGGAQSGWGHTGVALHDGRTKVIDNLLESALTPRWRLRAMDYNLGSTIAIPFKPDDGNAVLSIYDRHVNQFDEITTSGLEVIAKEVELIISHVRALERTEQALEETRAAFNTLAERERALTDSEIRFRVAFEDNMSPMVFSDLDDKLTAANDAFCRMIGYSREELIGKDSKQFTYPDDIGITEGSLHHSQSGTLDQMRYTKRYLRKDGHIIYSEVSRTPARDADGNILYYVFSERDVTEERQLTSQLSHQALHDPLTGLANRALLEDRLEHAHQRIMRQGGLGVVLILDLDDFKAVNDAFGHVMGDQLLIAAAHRLHSVTRATDTLCRFGGDEFLYLAEGIETEVEAETLARRLLAVLVEPFTIDEVTVEQHASIGVSIFDGEGDVDQFIQNADVALYEAKRQGKNKYVLFKPAMRDRLAGHFEMVQDLRAALANGTLAMNFQPIVRLDNSEIVGFEALMRWDHPVRGEVLPEVFIPLAEQSELIFDLGIFALNQAVTAASTWTLTGSRKDAPFVSVNLSARQFQDEALGAKIEAALTTSGLAPERLVIEITESVMLLDVAETSSVLSRLSRLGVDFALDDFGTGYSSLAYLGVLNPRIIKIDQSFVSSTYASERSDSLLEAIISLGRKLGNTMLAEGIETREQLEQLRGFGCELGQGFLFAPAVPPEGVASLIEGGSRQW
ncbi:MAG: EAL domain-containing protein [Acidobacteria bacterium]|nr:EAL domain-containing protein [Acidobacteriota bacterium]